MFFYICNAEMAQSLSSWSFHSSVIFFAKIEISGTKWVEKTPIYIFSTFGSKMNKFELKKWKKKRKNSKNQKFKDSDFSKLLRLCAISALQISKKHFAMFDFFKKMKLVSTVVH